MCGNGLNRIDTHVLSVFKSVYICIRTIGNANNDKSISIYSLAKRHDTHSFMGKVGPFVKLSNALIFDMEKFPLYPIPLLIYFYLILLLICFLYPLHLLWFIFIFIYINQSLNHDVPNISTFPWIIQMLL